MFAFLKRLKLNQKKRFSFSAFLLGAFFAFLVLTLVIAFAPGLTSIRGDAKTRELIIKPVNAAEIYPLFVCPCCGETIDAGCCDMAEERKKFVDSLVAQDKSKDEIILDYIKKYGLDSFKDKNLAEEFKSKLVEDAPKTRPIISADPTAYDFGNISQKEGVATTFFEIKNNGKKDLVINKLETSCGCTSASIVYRGKEGPAFAMPGHGVNENVGDWQVTIPPGETAQLKVYYDPDVHPDFRGFAVREIYIYSNDPIDFEKKVRIELNQVD